jgi:hypothetical protein
MIPWYIRIENCTWKKEEIIDEGEQKGDEGFAGLTARPKSFLCYTSLQ